MDHKALLSPLQLIAEHAQRNADRTTESLHRTADRHADFFNQTADRAVDHFHRNADRQMQRQMPPQIPE
jgi:hypothetical protein